MSTAAATRGGTKLENALVTAAYWLEHDHRGRVISTEVYHARLDVIEKALARPLHEVTR